ncbi:exocyst complex component EXO70H1-like [Curcuma longa]|uniref:exocyst complex component EXO70H1-like n=1 Tax=Curcuma longa TaxID=136217 RepID=UPI003D9F1724
MARKGFWRVLPRKYFSRRRRVDDSPSSSSEEASKLEETVARAEVVVVKWDPDSSAYANVTSLFHEDRLEARRFLARVCDLQRGMLDFVAEAAEPSRLSHPCLVRAQTLMQAAMRRLEKEFHQMLAANSDLLDPESRSVRSSRSSVSDDQGSDLWDESASPDQTDALAARESIAEIERAAAVVMTDLRAIADTMVFAGYGFECVRIYRTLRKSVVDEELYRLGFDRSLSSPQIKKMDWTVLELKIQSWLGACRVAVSTLFHRERVLIDQVFSKSNIVREAIFFGVAGDAALQLFAFPEWVAKSKWSPEKFFRLLDMHDAIGEVWPEVELVFSFESASSVRTQALASFAKLTEAVHGAFADFESTILREPARSVIPGGGVDPMTRYVTSYLTRLSNYHLSILEIFAELHPSPTQSAASDASSAVSISATGFAARLDKLFEAFLSHLERKANLYRDAALSNLFLANNLHYAVNRMRSCGLLGEQRAAQHSAKVRQYLAGYERMAWGGVAATVPVKEASSAAEARERMRTFAAALDEALSAQASWVVADAGMMEDIRATVREMVVPAYRAFCNRWRDVAVGPQLSPDEVRDRLGRVFSQSSGSDDSVRDSNRSGKSKINRLISGILKN